MEKVPMSEPSQLEAFLKSCEQGEVESKGEFSLDVNKALEKLAAYQLPFEYAWVLKIVQAAVASGTELLDIKQTSTDSIFRLSLPWDLDTIEEAFHRPPGTDRALSHLLTGLWAASLNNGRPFLINTDLNQDESLVWTGREFQRQKRVGRSHSSIMISHRQLSQGAPFPILGFFTASKINASISKLLSERASFCPLPISVDGRSLDVGSYPGHELKNHFFFNCGLAKPISAGMPTPPAVIKFVQKEIPGVSLGNECDSLSLLSVNFGTRTLLQKSGSLNGPDIYWSFRPKKQRSHLAWVLDGVVVQQDTLSVKESWISALVVANAAGLETDLTGFSLVQSSALEERKAAACRAVSALLNNCESPKFDENYGQVLPGSNIWGGVGSVLAGGAAGTVAGLLVGPASLAVMIPVGVIGGLGTFVKKNETIQALPVRAVARHNYESFKKEWLRRYP